ncbi:MAG: ATP-binding protein, partial [Chloroflexota bacterium]
SEERRAVADRTEGVLLSLRTGVAVVDERYDMSRINAAAREMLSIHGIAIGDDFVHLAVGLSSTELRAMIDAALRGEPGAAVFHTTTTTSEWGEGADLELSFTPVSPNTHGERSVVIEIRDVTAVERARTDLERRVQTVEAEAERAREAADDAQVSRVAKLEEELAERGRRLEEQAVRLQRSADTHRQLIAANREQTDAVALLRASNDELLISNEEVQASTEEVETLNEELQATNEELETLNEELQATIEELNATNTELEARTIELEEANEALVAQREISDRKGQRLATTMASMADAVMMVDERGEAMLTNEAYDELFAGAEADSVLEVTRGEPMPSREALEHRAAAGETFVDQFALRAPDGTRRWFEASGRPLRARNGERGGVVVIRDITDRSLRELQDQFVAMVAHELRTPLTALSGYVELLRRQLPDGGGDDRLRRFADRAVVQARRMSELVGDLLDASRLQRGGLEYTFETVDLAALTTEMVEVARTLDEIEIRITGVRRSIHVSGDTGRLQQVILNLLSNARQHGDGSIDVSLRRRGSRAELRIRDHGPGISREDLPRLFTRFFQGDGRSGDGGLGLGLYITREIVGAHHGTVEARSTRGKGATFVVSLPAVDLPAHGSRPSRSAASRKKG